MRPGRLAEHPVVVPRDVKLLGWISEQYAISDVQLARLMSRKVPTAVSLVWRWQAAGWVHARKLIVDEPRLVWPTADGRRIATSPHRPWQPSHGAVRHILRVNDVRMWLQELRPGAQWISERTLAQQDGHGTSFRRAHRPDGVLVAEQRAAVEVELTPKPVGRLGGIVEELLADHDVVWYFVSRATLPALQRLSEQIGDRLQVFPLSVVNG
jgi:hypothetical protein